MWDLHGGAYMGPTGWCYVRHTQQCVYYLPEIVRLLQVGNLSTAQDVVDVLKEAFLYDLSVVEDEHRCLVVYARLPVQPLLIYNHK